MSWQDIKDVITGLAERDARQKEHIYQQQCQINELIKLIQSKTAKATPANQVVLAISAAQQVTAEPVVQPEPMVDPTVDTSLTESEMLNFNFDFDSMSVNSLGGATATLESKPEKGETSEKISTMKKTNVPSQTYVSEKNSFMCHTNISQL